MLGPFRKTTGHRREAAVGAVGLGCLLSVIAFPTLFLNEGRAVRTARALAEGASAVVSVDSGNIDASNDGKLIHVSGHADTQETLTDDQFGVEVNAIRLSRHVEMYQWQETKENVSRRTNNRSTTEVEYRYEKVWSAEPLNSNTFQHIDGHDNPAEIPFNSQSIEAKTVHLDQYQLSSDQLAKIDDPQPLLVDFDNVPDQLSTSLRPDGGTSNSAIGFYWTADTGNSVAETSSATTEPVIGDVRIHFSVTYPIDVSVVAEQSGVRLKPFVTHNGRELSMLSSGVVSAEKMFQKAEAENTAMTWILRIIGTAFLVFGIGLVLQPLASMTNWIPLIGSMVEMGVALVAITVGGAFALLTVSVAWLFYRPLISIPLIVLSVGALVWLLNKSRLSTQHQPVSTSQRIDDTFVPPLKSSTAS